MRVVMVGIAIVGLLLLFTTQGPPTAAAESPGVLPDQLAAEISRLPTNRDNCAVRYHVMMQLGQLVHASLGQRKLEAALPFQRGQEIRQRLDEAKEEDARTVYRMLDESLLKLCDAGRESPLLKRLCRVAFPSPTGQRVVGYLVSPSAASDRAFVFGHGGFGHKEMWLDVMIAVADQTGSYALSIDFEGVGESSGYSTWSGRIGDFSRALDYLKKEYGVTRFAVGGHSGGGAWPAACAAIKDPRISAVVLWDCIFDFYDTHVKPDAPDPGGNPAALLDQASLQWRGKRLAPTEVAEFRQVEKHLDAIYEDIEKTMGHYRNTAQMLGQAQKQRQLAVLHIVAEDVTKPIGQPQVLQFTIKRPASESPVRQRFLNRPLRFTVSGLFGQRYKTWESQLGQPSRTVLIPNTTHGFEKPGRDLAVKNTVEWLNLHLKAETKKVGRPNAEPFIVLSEFQVWADAVGPEVFKELSRLYNEKGRSHIFDLYPRYDLFVWDSARMRHWVDEAKALGCFNLFCLGDDTRTAQGHLFDDQGVNPKLKEFLFQTVAYAHQQGFMVAVEPTHLPPWRTRAAFVPWLKSWLGPQVRAESRVDIIKLSIEWFGAWRANPEIATEVEAFFEAVQEVSPGTLVYVDSIGGFWRQPQVFHRWLLKRFPGTILSHYLNTDQIPAFRAIGARNLMVQVNPSEQFEAAGQFFIYHDFTVRLLKDVVAQRLRFVSLAGVNFGYDRYNYDLFLDVLRPHLKLARSLDEVRAALDLDTPADAPTAEEVANALIAVSRARAEEKIRQEPPPPLNPKGEPACFGETPDGWIMNLAKIMDGKSGGKFEGAYTEPIRRKPVRATFGLDFGATKSVRTITIVPCFAEAGPEYVAKALRVEYRTGAVWKQVPGAKWTDNAQRRIRVNLETPLSADAIRVVIASQSDDGKGNYRACCQKIEVD